ncbi:uncharacterized protein G2W53_018197 [Senna tora]|uniref:Uncharacterized protein n=1 Tax=Senna tora TaxID=362788 RepID=A0A834TRJ7_9FABA|nr:uncharacterized protein G2W53_018197 [Senna tora]
MTGRPHLPKGWEQIHKDEDDGKAAPSKMMGTDLKK